MPTMIPRGWRRYARWQTLLEGDFSEGIFRDVDRTSIPPGGVYDSLDFFLHRPRKAFKRGGWAYASDALGSDDYAMTCAYANFLVGPQLVAVGSTGINTSGALYKIASDGTVTSMGGSIPYMVDRPKLFLGGAQSILVFPGLGSTVPIYYDGANVPQTFPGGATTITTGAQVAGDYLVTITGTPTGGSFKLDLTAQADPVAGGPATTGLNAPVSFRTGAIAYNASAADVKTAIDAALAPAVTTCTTTGGGLPGTPVGVTLPAGWSVAYVPASVAGVTLTGGTDPNGAITNTTSGTGTTDPVSVPMGRFCWSFNEHLVLANSVDNQNRVWYSPLLNVTSIGWDLANSWLDLDENISGGTSLSGQQVVFSANGFWRITGTTPPPNSDFIVERIADIGCTDARSILVYEGQCIFANPRGVYITTGVAPVNLMEDRIASYWQTLLAGYTPSADNNAEWCITTGLYGGRFLYVTVLGSSGAHLDTLVCDLPRRAWTRLSNHPARNYSTAYGVQEELFFASRATNRVVKTSGEFSPVSANSSDADGTAIEPVLETRPVAVGIGLKAFGDSELQYDMRELDPVTPAKVFKSDASAADAWIEKDLGVGHSEIWVTYKIGFAADALAFWAGLGDTSPEFLSMGLTTGDSAEELLLFDFGSGLEWADSFDHGGSPTSDVLLTVEQLFTNSGTTQVYVDSVLVIDTIDTSGRDIRFIRLGQTTSEAFDPSQIVYFDDVKAGTARGSSSLFSDDFQSGDLSAWTTTSGTVSVVDSPF